MVDNSNTPEDVTREGERIYFDKLKDILEPAHNGEYVAIEVESGEYFVNKDLLTAIQEARIKYPNKLLHIVPIGELNKPSISHQKVNYAWHLR